MKRGALHVEEEKEEEKEKEEVEVEVEVVNHKGNSIDNKINMGIIK